MALDTYGHVIAELDGSRHLSAAEQILAARTTLAGEPEDAEALPDNVIPFPKIAARDGP